MSPIQTNKVRRSLQALIRRTAEEQAGSLGIGVAEYLSIANAIVGETMTVAEAAEKLGRSTQWVTAKLREHDLGEREAWYGRTERYRLSASDMDKLVELRDNTRRGRRVGFTSVPNTDNSTDP